MSRILHFAPATPNLGDSLLNLGAQKWIDRIWGPDHDRMTLPSHAHYLNRLGKKNGYEGGLTPDFINIWGKPDVIVIGGGPIWNMPTLLALVEQTHLGTIPVVVLGVGEFEYNRPVDPILARRLIPHIRVSTARDQQTSDNMSKVVDERTPIFMTGCPALHLVGRPISIRSSTYFLVCFRRESVNQHDLKCTPEFVRKLETCFGQKAVVSFHDYRDYYLYAGAFTNKDITCICLQTPEAAIHLATHASFTVTYRLHGAILSATCGTPFFHIAIDDRGYYFGQTFDPDKLFSAYPNRDVVSQSDILDKIRQASQANYSTLNARIQACKNTLEDVIISTRANVPLSEQQHFQKRS